MVELLARSADTALRFSDVARELQLTQATTHAILKTLCDRGWASRDPVAKTFMLGPALAVVAARTENARPLTHAARGAVLRLAQEVGYAGSVVERFDESLVITAFEGAVATEPSGLPGDRIPYAPPFGVAFAAWDSVDGQREWIRRGAGSSQDRIRRLEGVLARTRHRGFDVDCTTPALAQAAQLVGTLQSDQMPPSVRQVMDQLLVEFTASGAFFDQDDGDAKGSGEHPVATVAAPVFDHRRRVALIIAVHPLCALNADQIRMIGGRVADEASRLSLSET